jgi:hypothetical protein
MTSSDFKRIPPSFANAHFATTSAFNDLPLWKRAYNELYVQLRRCLRWLKQSPVQKKTDTAAILDPATGECKARWKAAVATFFLLLQIGFCFYLASVAMHITREFQVEYSTVDNQQKYALQEYTELCSAKGRGPTYATPHLNCTLLHQATERNPTFSAFEHAIAHAAEHFSLYSWVFNCHYGRCSGKAWTFVDYVVNRPFQLIAVVVCSFLVAAWICIRLWRVFRFQRRVHADYRQSLQGDGSGTTAARAALLSTPLRASIETWAQSIAAVDRAQKAALQYESYIPMLPAPEEDEDKDSEREFQRLRNRLKQDTASAKDSDHPRFV